MDERDRSALYREPTRAALLGLAVNLGLGIAKLVGGLVGRSFALVADAINSFGDVVASVVVLAGLGYAQRPADEAHPYGHTRAEAVAGSNVALLIVLSAVWIAWEAVERLPVRHALPEAWTLAIAGGNVILKEALFRYKRDVGRRTGSQAVTANAWDHRSDAFASLAVVVGLSLVLWGGPSLIWADEAAALLVAGAIAWAGIGLFRTSASDLMDRQAEPELLERVETTVRTVEGVRDVETLLLRKSGLEYFADLHVEVDRDLTVEEGHELGHRVKDRLLGDFPLLRDVLVHVEPWRRPPG